MYLTKGMIMIVIRVKPYRVQKIHIDEKDV